MASLALGLAGAAVGSMFGPLGASVGWMLGSAVGNMLDPQKVQGPRLDDLKLHNSSYGGITPFLWGTMRVAGNIIDEQPEYTEHEASSGGKGGPEVTEYTYTCSFAVRLCEGPILGILRIWANGRLIYDRTGGTELHDDLPLTIYLGTEEQLPDPTLETIHGAGNVPAYRGIAYVVFTDLLLTEFGNALPNLNFEVYTRAGEIPIRVSSFTPNANASSSNILEAVTYDTETEVITSAVWKRFPINTYYRRSFLLDGTPTGTDIIAQPYGAGQLMCVVNNLDVAMIIVGGVQSFWFVNGVQTNEVLLGGDAYNNAIYQDGFIYAIHGPGGPTGIMRFPATDGIPAVSYDRRISVGSSASGLRLGTSDNGKIYLREGADLYEYNAELELTHQWGIADWPADFNTAGGDYSFVRYHDFFAFSYGSNKLNLVSIASDDTLSLYPQDRDISNGPTYPFGNGPVITLAGGLVLGIDGVTNLDAPPEGVPLSVIVGELSERTGLAPSQYDVDELTDLVDGYLVNQQATTRDIIQPLRDGYFFDAVERDAQAVFVKRGREPSIAIPDDELAAHGDGDAVPPIIGTVRAQEVDLPRVVNIDYINLAADYQTGTQAARRQVTQSESEVSLNLPISMTDVKAKSVADVQLFTAWLERNRFTFFTSRKYAAYDPTDVIAVNGRAVRVIEKNETRPGVVKWDGVESLVQAWIQAGGAVSVDFVPSPPGGVVVTGDTTAYLLDLPLVSEADDPDGFYAAMTWASGGGAGLYKSADGIIYTSTASTTVRATMGTALNTLGDFTGGNLVDEGNYLDVLTLDGGELVSITDAALLNGGNLCSVGGDEVLQFKRAELIDVDTYRLTGLLRGRLGTEFAIATHGADEEFALLPTTIRVHQDYAELYVSRAFKPVTFGQTLADADAQSFTNTGAARRPYSPQLLGGGTDGAGDVELHWTRRTRLGGGAWLSVDVPLAEPEEIYSVLIWNEDYSLCAREIVVVAATVTSYTAADQVLDFGATQQTIFFSVRQVGTAALGTEARGSAPGAGASNVDPLAPITPPT